MAQYKRLSDKEKKDILRDIGQGAKIADKAKEYGVAYNTIKNLYNTAKKGGKFNDVLQKSEEIAEINAKEVLSVLESNVPYQIVQKTLTILNDNDLLKREIKQRGISGVTSMIKMLLETSMKYQDTKDRKDEEENKLRIEDNNFKNAMLDAVNSLSEIDTKVLEAAESYVQED